MRKILLDPVDFDALHLSFLAHGGVGGTITFAHRPGGPAVPHCVLGHAAWLDGLDQGGTETALETDFGIRLYEAGLTWERNDDVLCQRGVRGQKIDFETYIKLLNIDVKA